MGVFKDDIQELYKSTGEKIVVTAAKEFMQKMYNPDKDVRPTGINNIEKGQFYFMMYDMGSKASKMEKLSPVFVVDWNLGGASTLWAVSLNFIPVNIRIVIFDAIINGSKDVYIGNKGKDAHKNRPYSQVNLTKMYKMLQQIGFEYAIREYDLRLIDKLYAVSASFLPKLIAMSTELFTGVGEYKMAEIWAAKIKHQEERHKEFVQDLWNNYDKMYKTMTDEIKSANRASDDLASVITNIKTANNNK
jgi:hypothetical protein